MKNYIILLTLIALLLIISSDLSTRIKAISSIILLFISGILLSKHYEGSYGLVLIKGKSHKKLYSLSPSKKIIELFTDLSFFLGFGVFSLIFRKIELKRLFFGFVLSIAFYFIVFPYVFLTISHTPITINPVKAVVFSIFGFTTVTLFSMFSSTYNIFYSIYTGATATPGASLLLPGINLPFVEGVLAIAILAVLHEAGHAIVALYHKIKIKSSGIVLFGIVPIGAFVEPDEQDLSKKPKKVQQDVLVAGSGVNFLLSLFSGILLFIYLFIFSSYSVTGFVVTAPHQGMIIYSLNNQSPLNFSAGPNQTVFASTNIGELSFKTDENGKLNISGFYADKDAPYFTNTLLSFIYNLLALSTTLNFIIASMNLLPIYLLDGQRIFSISLNKNISKAITILTTLCLLINFLPWFL